MPPDKTKPNNPHQSSLRTKHLQEVANELPGFLLPFLDEVDALLLHLLDKLFALLLHISHFPLHLVHTLLQVVLLLLVRVWDSKDHESPKSQTHVGEKCLESYEFSYVDEADVELLGCVSSLQVTSDVHVVVADDACDDVRGGDALCPLGGSKHT